MGSCYGLEGLIDKSHYFSGTRSNLLRFDWSKLDKLCPKSGPIPHEFLCVTFLLSCTDGPIQNSVWKPRTFVGVSCAAAFSEFCLEAKNVSPHHRLLKSKCNPGLIPPQATRIDVGYSACFFLGVVLQQGVKNSHATVITLELLKTWSVNKSPGHYFRVLAY